MVLASKFLKRRLGGMEMEAGKDGTVRFKDWGEGGGEGNESEDVWMRRTGITVNHDRRKK